LSITTSTNVLFLQR